MIPSTNPSQDPNIKTFFNTHNSTKAFTLPEMTAEMLEEISSRIPSILIRSPILTRITKKNLSSLTELRMNQIQLLS